MNDLLCIGLTGMTVDETIAYLYSGQTDGWRWTGQLYSGQTGWTVVETEYLFVLRPDWMDSG